MKPFIYRDFVNSFKYFDVLNSKFKLLIFSHYNIYVKDCSP